MNLKKLQSHITTYKNYLQSPEANDECYKWETLKYFQENWNTEAEDLETMYDISFSNTTSRRQWKGHDFYPKEMMLKLIQTEPEYVRLAFRDLFNDTKEITGRVDRFIFYCDELLEIYKKQHPKTKDNNHYHNHEVVMMYLSCKFPAKYSLYSFSDFSHFLQSVDAKPIPQSHDLERFTKITRTISIFLKKDEQIQELLQERFDAKHYQKDNRLPIHEFLKILNPTS